MLLLVFVPKMAFSNDEKLAKEQTFETQESSEQKDHDASKLVEPTIKRRQVDIAKVDAEDFEIELFYGAMNVVDFGTNPIESLVLSYHVTEDLFVSASYGQTKTEQTSFEVISGARLLTDAERNLRYYDLNAGVNLLPGEGFIGKNIAFNSAFYAVLGVGSTKFAGDQRFTYSGGLGYRVILKDWSAVSVEVKDHVFNIDILGKNKTTHNLSYQLGLSFFF